MSFFYLPPSFFLNTGTFPILFFYFLFVSLVHSSLFLSLSFFLSFFLAASYITNYLQRACSTAGRSLLVHWTRAGGRLHSYISVRPRNFMGRQMFEKSVTPVEVTFIKNQNNLYLLFRLTGNVVGRRVNRQIINTTRNICVLNITCRSLRLRVAKRMQSVGTFAS
jgi:hypothetical protein